ncbi:MAG: CPBP family intramembrane metalloprotease [bacterium]|nr:CPBP family intramembrane metalloprotease [bacterium]
MAVLQEEPEVVMSFGDVLVSMLLGLVGIGVSLYLMRGRLLPAWTMRNEPDPDLPWNPMHLVLLFLVALLSNSAVNLILYLIYGDVGAEELGTVSILVSSIFDTGLVAVGVWTLGQTLGAGSEAYGLHKAPSRRHFFIGLATCVACVPALFGASLVWSGLLHLIGEQVEPQDVSKLVQAAALHERWAVLLLAGVIVPILEEFLFRGFLQTWLVKAQGAALGILLTSFFFALFHETSSFGPILVIALAAGCIRHATGSLWPAVVVHIINNSIVTCWLFYGAGSLGS